MDDVQATFPWKGDPHTVRRTGQTSGTPPAVESPILGTARPPGTMCLRKSGSPQNGACQKTTKGQTSRPLSGWPQVPSGVPGVLFPFFREDVTSSPSEYKRLPPSGENPKTHGAPAGQDSVPQGGNQGRARSAVEESRIASQVINLSIVIHVGLNNSE